MSKTAIIYWSGTGNTKTMADLFLSGFEAKGDDVTLFTSADFDVSTVNDYDTFVLGCPSMGAEVLEECEFEPMYQDIKADLSGKNVVLFGSYGWGDGEWMRNWKDDVEAVGANVCGEPVICCGSPEGETESEISDIVNSL